MSASGEYLLGDSPAEIRHVVEQAAVYAEEATALLDRLDLAPRSSAIDFGCGALGVLHLLADRIGPEGRVVGLDREPRMLETAKRLAADRGLAIELIQADATATGLPDATFDLVHARTLLLNVDNPHEVAAEMVRIARTGGLVAVQEPDASAWTCDPPHDAFEFLRDAVVDAYHCTGKDFNIGRRTGRILREVGLENVEVRATARVTHAGDYYQTFLLTITDLVRDVILEDGRMSAEGLGSAISALGAHLEQPDTVTCQPLMWQAWGRKAR
jgi:SAM-dependent methyltransferase